MASVRSAMTLIMSTRLVLEQELTERCRSGGVAALCAA